MTKDKGMKPSLYSSDCSVLLARKPELNSRRYFSRKALEMSLTLIFSGKWDAYLASTKKPILIKSLSAEQRLTGAPLDRHVILSLETWYPYILPQNVYVHYIQNIQKDNIKNWHLTIRVLLILFQRALS